MPDRPLDNRGLPAGYTFHDDYELTPRDIAADRTRYYIIDVREADELRIAAIDGTAHLPLGMLETRIDDIEPDDGQSIVTLCHHGVRSMRAALALRQLGFPKAMSIAGGIDLWSRDIDSSVPRY